MKKRVRQAALQLLLLQEEFTQSELAEAAAMISQEAGSPLIDLLSSKTRKKRPDQTRADSKNGHSKAVESLKDSDPERYRLLLEFEQLLRDETLLHTLEEMRRFAVGISKEFQTAKSRKETIPRLMELLKTMPIDVVRDRLGELKDEAESEGNDKNSFQNLARYLISGSMTKS